MNLSQPPQPTPTTMSGGDCSNCGTHSRFILHHVRLRGIHRRLCTACVLRLHPSSFCPSCFAFYDSNPPHPSKRITCSKCSSFTHSHCATSSSISPTQPFLCPLCSDSDPAIKIHLSFFNNKSLARTSNGAASSNARDSGTAIDKKSAGMLLCAAKISAASMGRAAAVARIDADRKVKDAAVARKRAREALERVAVLMCKRNDGNVHQGSVQQSGTDSFFNAEKKQKLSQEALAKNVQNGNGRLPHLQNIHGSEANNNKFSAPL